MQNYLKLQVPSFDNSIVVKKEEEVLVGQATEKSFSEQLCPRTKQQYYQRFKANHPETKNILTNLGTCLKNYIKHDRLGKLFVKEKAFKQFVKKHAKTRDSYTKLFTMASDPFYLFLEGFFKHQIVRLILIGRYNVNQKINYLKHVESMLIGYERRELKNIQLS